MDTFNILSELSLFAQNPKSMSSYVDLRTYINELPYSACVFFLMNKKWYQSYQTQSESMDNSSYFVNCSEST